MNLRANCICRSGIVVLTRTPARLLGAPVPSKMSVLPSPTWGGAKFGWFRMLNISIRNCTLKFSEMRLMRLFLNREKSRLVIPGPIRLLRPELPRRLKHCGEVASTGGTPEGVWALGGAGSQFAAQVAGSGQVGTVRHWVLM